MKGIRVVIEVDPTACWTEPGQTLDDMCRTVSELRLMNGHAVGSVVVRVDCGGIGNSAMQYMRNNHDIPCEPLPKLVERPRAW